MTRKRKSYDIPIDTGDERTPPSAAGEAEDAAAAGRDRTPPPDLREETAGRGGNGETPEDVSLEQAVDDLRRLKAEFVNYRRRTDRERMETHAWAQGQLVEKLLPVLDDFDRAEAAAAAHDPASVKGFHLIREKLARILVEAGLERIEAEGAAFDPELHEALLTQQVEPERAGRVLQEIEPGYLFKGRLVRPARVQVGVTGDD